MAYVDGFLLAVKTGMKDAYIKMAEDCGPIFLEYGALKMVETWGDDVPEGKLTSFPMAVKKKDDESVVFSWVIWPDKETRDAGWQKMRDDPEMAKMEMPFDGKRLIYGGFELLLEA